MWIPVMVMMTTAISANQETSTEQCVKQCMEASPDQEMLDVLFIFSVICIVGAMITLVMVFCEMWRD